jgi:hypothetical protein
MTLSLSYFAPYFISFSPLSVAFSISVTEHFPLDRSLLSQSSSISDPSDLLAGGEAGSGSSFVSICTFVPKFKEAIGPD